MLGIKCWTHSHVNHSTPNPYTEKFFVSLCICRKRFGMKKCETHQNVQIGVTNNAIGHSFRIGEMICTSLKCSFLRKIRSFSYLAIYRQCAGIRPTVCIRLCHSKSLDVLQKSFLISVRVLSVGNILTPVCLSSVTGLIKVGKMHFLSIYSESQ